MLVTVHRRKSSGLLALLAVLAAVGTAGCSGAPNAEPVGDRMPVFTAIEPVACVVRRVGGRHVDVGVLVPAGQDPHTFEPTPRQIAALGRARLFFKVGVPLEERILEKLVESHHALRVVDTTEGIQKRAMTRDGSDGEPAHAAQHDHSEATSGADPHVWLAPSLIRVQAENIAEALVRADPAHAEEYRANLAAFLRDLGALDAKIRRRLEPHKGRTFFVFHPSYGYFADQYGLKQEAVQIEGKSPTPRQLRALVQHAKAEGVRIIFAQPQFDQRSPQAVAEAIGGTVVSIDPLAEDLLANLDAMSAKIAAALAAGEENR